MYRPLWSSLLVARHDDIGNRSINDSMNRMESVGCPCTPCIMCAQYIGGGGRGGRGGRGREGGAVHQGYHEYIGGYYEYIGGYHEYIGGCSVHQGDIMMHVREGYHDACEGAR